MTAALVCDASATSDPAPGLPATIRTLLGQLLGQAYAKLPDSTAAPSDDVANHLERLVAALTARSERDERVFRAEFTALMPNLFPFALRLTKNHARADDLLQDTLMKAWRSRARFEHGTNLGAWLFTIMRNGFYSSHRSAKYQVLADADDEAGRLVALPVQQDHLDLQDVQAAIGRLPDAMRRALLLTTLDNLSYEEAAATMRCQVGTIKSRVWRARERLAADLGFSAGELGADHVTLAVFNGTA